MTDADILEVDAALLREDQLRALLRWREIPTEPGAPRAVLEAQLVELQRVLRAKENAKQRRQSWAKALREAARQQDADESDGTSGSSGSEDENESAESTSEEEEQAEEDEEDENEESEDEEKDDDEDGDDESEEGEEEEGEEEEEEKEGAGTHQKEEKQVTADEPPHKRRHVGTAAALVTAVCAAVIGTAAAVVLASGHNHPE